MIRFRSKAALACLIVFMPGIVNAHPADAKNGKVLFERCAACHSLEANKSDIAPSLAGIFGRKAASLEDFRYSTAMKQSNVTWDERTLDAFIEDPQAFIPGNRMPFDGLKDEADREDLLAYLKLATKNSDSAQLQSSLIRQWVASKQPSVNDAVTMRRSYGRMLLDLAEFSAAWFTALAYKRESTEPFIAKSHQARMVSLLVAEVK